MRRLMPLVLVILVAAATATAAESRKVRFGPVSAEVPAAWQAQPPRSQMRVADYRVPRASGDPADASFVVFFFEGGGGSADDNVARWRGMFKQPAGRPSESAGKVEKLKVRKFTVTTLDIEGTFLDSPMPGSGDVTERASYRMLNAVVEGEGGPLYFRFVGPSKTIAANKAAWDRMLKSLGG